MQNDTQLKFKEIQKILSEEWDAVPDAPTDEYDSHIHRIISMYADGNLDTTRLTSYLDSLFGIQENTKEISEKLLSILSV
ncbi:MAG: hypothetical protein AB199_01445 [Parcubacteria bacterium C7867-004]|nr:MAG: hypothetical protein AB199_01445 [Parcubacteria bacterium C7867-004]